ncbi:MAG: hypothetical protein AB1445_15555 [Bacillota bacterium]
MRPQEARRVYVRESLAAEELTSSQGAELLGCDPKIDLRVTDPDGHVIPHRIHYCDAPA